MILKALVRYISTKASTVPYLLSIIIISAGLTVPLEYHLLSHTEAAEVVTPPENVANGTAIYIGTVGAFSNSTFRGKAISITNDGIRIAFEHQNKYMNGIRGRPIKLVLSETTNDNPSNVAPRLNDLLTHNDSQYKDMTSLINILGETHCDEAAKWSNPRKMTILQPVTEVKSYYAPFSMGHVNMSPSPDESLISVIRYLVYNRQVKRIALMSFPDTKQGIEIVPEAKRLCLEVGAEFVYHMKVYANVSKVDMESIGKMMASKPQAVISWLPMYDISVMTIGAVLNFGSPDLIIAGSTVSILTIGMVLKNVPNDIIGDRIVKSFMAPLPTDTSFAVVRRFREEAAIIHDLVAYEGLNKNHIMDIVAFEGYLAGRFTIQLHLDMHIQTKEQLRETLFDNQIINVDGIVYGPFSKECVDNRSIFCACHNGARNIYFGQFTSNAILPIPGSEYEIPVGSCSKVALSLPAPLVSVMVHPKYETGRKLYSAFELGQKAALVSSSRIVQLFHHTPYSYGSNRILDNMAVDQIVTAVVGSILDESVLWGNLSTIIDPFFETPVLNPGFQRQTIYLMPTLDQELFALAHYAADVAKADLRLLSAASESAAKPIAAALVKSLHTFAVSTGGGVTSVSSIQAGLDAINGDSGIVILHGIKTAADVTAIKTALIRNPELRIALPMAHLETWYSELMNTVTKPLCERIIFATSLPNWGSPAAPPATQSAVMASFFDSIPETNRSPTALRGFMTHRVLMGIAERTPQPITAAKLLDTLYMTAVVAIGTDLVVGPFYGDKCTESNSKKCETNAGARDLSVRTLSGVMPSSLSRNPVSRISFSSGQMVYLPLPTADITMYLAIGIVSGIFVLVLIAVIVFFYYCTGRRNRAAPKNSDEPFTIVFTDIQGSTSLWAEVPVAMAPALDHHHAIIRELILAHKGYEVKTIGDAFMIAFHDASDAIEMAVALQERFFIDNTWPPEIDVAYKAWMSRATVDEEDFQKIAISDKKYPKLWNGIRVRIGINTGLGDIKKDETTGAYDYYGTVVNTAARVEAAGHGGQVLITRVTYDAAIERTPELLGIVTELGSVELRGLSEPVELLQVNSIKGRTFLPLRLDLIPRPEEGEFLEGTNRDIQDSFSTSHESTVVSKKQNTSHFIAHDFIKMMFAVLGKDKIPTLKELCNKWRVKPKTNTSVSAAGLQDGNSQGLTALPQSTPTTEDASIAYINALVGKLGPILHRKMTDSGVIGTDGKVGSYHSGDDFTLMSSQRSSQKADESVQNSLLYTLELM